VFLPPLEGKSGMGSNSIVSNRWMSEKMNCLDLSPNSKSDNEEEEVHVLAVDDSFVDRKVIERLLKISSCKGKLRPCL
jgi:two-component response regulator (ARR-A family)